MPDDLLTPAIVIDGGVVEQNLRRLAAYAKSRRLNLRPHTKTHKSVRFAAMQLEHGAAGLTVAKASEARVMARVAGELDLLVAYPAVDAARSTGLGELAHDVGALRVAIDSTHAVDLLAAAARSAATTIGALVDLDVGYRRTGVQTPQSALALAQHISRAGGLRLDGIMFFPGHVWEPPAEQAPALQAIDALIGEVKSLWSRHGLDATIVSGGSTPTAYQSHLMQNLTEIRPGTYIFNDMNCVAGGFCEIGDCAARVVCTVVSDAVPGQVVIDAGSKTLTSDRCHPAPESGHGLIVEFPAAKISRLSEEHGQVDVTKCDRAPKLGQRVTVIPNHICPCVNLQDRVFWLQENEAPRPVAVDARGLVV